MKKLFLFIALLLPIGAYAQTITDDDLGYKPFIDLVADGNIVEATKVIIDTYPTQNDGSVTYTYIVEGVKKDKEQSYQAIKSWFIANFRDANEVIQHDDKEAGTIIGVGINRIDEAGGGFTDARKMIRCDIKYGRVRIMITIQEYHTYIPRSQYVREQDIRRSCADMNDWYTKGQMRRKWASKIIYNTHTSCMMSIVNIKNALLNNPTEAPSDDW